MLTCFLFAKCFDRDAILSLCLDLDGRVDKPLKARSIEEVRALQVNARTVVVLPSQWCSLHLVELPWLPYRKALEAIPFALEEQLAQSVSHLHFAFDRVHYQNNTYLVAVIDKLLLQEWTSNLQLFGLSYEAITLDWFALLDGEGCEIEKTVLVSSDQFKGALSVDVWEHKVPDWANTVTWYRGSSDSKTIKMPIETTIESPGYVWIAQRLLKNKPMNLCQGEFQHDTSQTQIRRWYQLSAIVAGIWLLSFLAIHGGMLLILSHKNKLLDQEMASAYRVFFPQATQVVSPKLRITQLLKQNQSGYNAVLWTLLGKLSAVLANAHPAIPSTNTTTQVADQLTVVQELQFQNPTLTILLACDSFAGLEKIEAGLQKARVNVKQLSAATEVDKVMAKLELSL